MPRRFQSSSVIDIPLSDFYLMTLKVIKNVLKDLDQE